MILLKTLFGTAMISDVHMLRDVLNNLKPQNSEMVLFDQLTYVKKLSTTVKLDTNSIANLSYIIRDNVILAHDQFQQMARGILWLNVNFFGQSTLHVMIIQLEFTLMQLIQQVNDLSDAIQLAIQGTLSIKLINPMTLQGILRNVTLQLPEGY